MLPTFVANDDDDNDGTLPPDSPRVDAAALLRPFLPVLRQSLPLLCERARRGGVPAWDVDDVVNDALVSAALGMRQHPPPPPEDEERVKAWLLDRVKWAVREYWTNQKRMRESLWENPEAAQSVPDGRDAAGTVNERQRILLALEKVKPENEKILLAHDIEDEPVSDLARALDIPYATAYARLWRGRGELRDALAALESPGVNPRRRRRLLLPFGFAGVGTYHRALRPFFYALEGLRGLARVPARLFASCAAAMAVMAFTPDGDPCAAAGETPVALAVSEQVRHVERRLPVITSLPGAVPTSVSVPQAFPVSARGAAPRKAAATLPRKQAAPVEAPPWDISLAVMAGYAVRSGDGQKAQALLDMDSSPSANPTQDQVRDLLRGAASSRAGAQTKESASLR